MSYVLDALKKAEAERHRGEVPGLHAAPSALGPAAPAARAPLHPVVWVAAGAVVVGLGVVAWRFGMTPSAAPSPAPAPVVATPTPTPAPAPIAAVPSPAPAPAPAPPPAAPPVAAVPAPRAPVPTAAAPAPRPVPAPVPAPTAAIAPAAPPPVAATVTPRTAPSAAPGTASAAVAAAPAPAAPAAAASAAESRVLSIAELPPELRRELPTLVVSGSVYSELPSARFVILNGQLMHEGEKLGQELVLEQIQLRSAVLRYKGTRFRIAY